MIPRQNKDNGKFVLVYCYIMASDGQNFIFIHIQHGNYFLLMAWQKVTKEVSVKSRCTLKI